MTQPDNSARRSPRQCGAARTDSTHPAPGRPAGRRGTDRRPWPTAPTTTRVSPAKPAKTTTGTGRTRARGSASSPTPATVWTTGATPIALDATWPSALVERIVTSFSKPTEQVVLLNWPTPDQARPDHELAAAVAVVERRDRTARVERVPVHPTSTGPATRPFLADLVDDVDPSFTALPTAPEATVEIPGPETLTDLGEGADLIVASLPPHLFDNHAQGNTAAFGADLMALYTARRLRVGGILAVLTHCDWTSGELTDPTGTVVTAGQNADLLYLQHIVAVHAPVRDGRFDLTGLDPDPRPDTCSHGVHGDRYATGGGTDARHRDAERGLSAPHRRIHSDVLVFAQPHAHQPTLTAPRSAPTDPASRPEDLRRIARSTPHRAPTSPHPDRTARKARP